MPLASWLHYRTVTVDNTGYGAASGVQVRIILDSVNAASLFVNSKSDGSDLRVTDSDGSTLLPFWRQRWDATNQVAELYVKCDLPSASSKTLYVYYGNSGASDVSNYDSTMTKAAVDASVIFMLHCDEGSGTPVDATGTYTVSAVNGLTWNGADGGNWRNSSQAFASGDSIKLNGSSQRLEIAGLLNSPPSALTVAFWFRPAATGTSQILFRKNSVASPEDTLQMVLAVQGSTPVIAWQRYKSGSFVNGPDGNNVGYGNHPIANGNWYHAILTCGAAGIRCFINGEVDLAIRTETTVLAAGSNAPCEFGGYSGGLNFNGDLDEILILDRQIGDQEAADLFSRRKTFPRSTQYAKLTRSGSNPVITPTLANETIDLPGVAEISVMLKPGDATTLQGWWHGSASDGRLIYGTSTDGVTWTKTSTPVLGGGNGGESGNLMVPSVYYRADNSTYYCFYAHEEEGSPLSYATSSDGVTWTAVGTAISNTGTSAWPRGCDNTGVYWDGTNWHILLEGFDTDGVWRTGLYSGTTLGSLTQIQTPSTCGWGLSSSAPSGGPFIQKIGSYFYGWGHGTRDIGHSFPTQIYCKRAPSLSGPWVEIDQIPIVQPEDGSTEIIQAADPCVVEAFGSVLFYWEGANDSSVPPGVGTNFWKINLATYSGTLASFVADSAEPAIGSEQTNASASIVVTETTLERGQASQTLHVVGTATSFSSSSGSGGATADWTLTGGTVTAVTVVDTTHATLTVTAPTSTGTTAVTFVPSSISSGTITVQDTVAPNSPTGLTFGTLAYAFTFSWTAVPPSPSGETITYDVKKNGTTVSSGQSGTSYAATGIANSDVLGVDAKDNSGNTSTLATKTFTAPSASGGVSLARVLGGL